MEPHFLKHLLNIKGLGPDTVMPIVITALNPLQVSLELARLRLQDYDKEDIWHYCYITGTSALISGYAFLGQDVPHVRAELEATMKNVQIVILNEIACRTFPQKRDFPWDRVPLLMSPKGADELLELYQSTTKESAPSLPPVPDVDAMTVEQIRAVIRRTTDVRVLQEMLSQEKTGNGRVTAIEAIERRISSLS